MCTPKKIEMCQFDVFKKIEMCPFDVHLKK